MQNGPFQNGLFYTSLVFFPMGRCRFQLGVGGKTWKCVLIRVETATKTYGYEESFRVEKLSGKFQYKTFFSSLG